MLTFQKKYLLTVAFTALASCTASITPNPGAIQPSPATSSTPAPTSSPGSTTTPNTATVSANAGTPVFDATLNGNLNAYRDQVGKEVTIKTVGSLDGRVWGDVVYTDDSEIGTAAVHAGLLKPGQQGIVRIVILPGQETYASATRHGVESSDYGSWPGSYQFVLVNAGAVPNSPVSVGVDALPANQAIYKNPGSVGAYRNLIGQQILFEVKANTTGTVWGTDVYTDDSDLGAAALHAGLLKDNETGILAVEILPARETYMGSLRNGVTTFEYGSWGGSFKFVGPARYVNQTGSLTIIANPTP
jgi:hypothetical protein